MRICDGLGVLLYALLVCSVASLSTTTTTTTLSNGIQYIAGQRCLFQKCADTTTTIRPPIVLLGGMAQTIPSLEHLVPPLAKDRHVLVYECRGQGPLPPEVNKDTVYHNVSLARQGELLCQTINVCFPKEHVDIVGFSLGGRVAMAAALSTTNLNIRRLHLTGVATERGPMGQVAVESWKDLLQTNQMRGFAWSALMNTYSSAYLHTNRQRLSTFVQFIVESNTRQGLQALVEQTHSSVVDNEMWSTMEMAKRIRQEKNMMDGRRGRLVVGELDHMAPVQHATTLLQHLGWNGEVGVFANCGHAVPMENPREWRNDVLTFLDKE